jgi:hypothetical protein
VNDFDEELFVLLAKAVKRGTVTAAVGAGAGVLLLPPPPPPPHEASMRVVINAVNMRVVLNISIPNQSNFNFYHQ